MSDYRAVNLANWNERAEPHAASAGYRVAELIADPAMLSKVVTFDAPRLGRLDGLRVVHLQCHIGTDTVSLARLGAASVTGVDFSDKALEEARRLAAAAAGGENVSFVQSDVYEALAATGGGFDVVYTGIGALCWLPDIKRWARTVASLLKPGGRLFIREGHPVLWSLDYYREDDLIALDTTYFEQQEPSVFDEPGTYVDTTHQFQHTLTHEWNHGIGEIVTALIEVGMTITQLVEHDTAPWCPMPGKFRELDNGEWQLIDRPSRLPHTYTLQAFV